MLCDAGKGSGKSAGPAAADESQQPAAKRVEEMDLDEFLDGGFEAAAAAGGSDSGSEEDAPSSDLASDDADLDDVISDEDDVMAPGQAGGSDGDESEGEDVSDGEGDAAGGPEGAAVAADNKRLKGAVARHKQQLEALKDKDPEFYAYLQVGPQQLSDCLFGTSRGSSGVPSARGATQQQPERLSQSSSCQKLVGVIDSCTQQPCASN